MSPRGDRPVGRRGERADASAAGSGRAARRLGAPIAIAVRADPVDGRPLSVDGREVEAVRESWLVEDRWWTEHSLRRRYWEVVTTCGRDLVVFRDLEVGSWHRQR